MDAFIFEINKKLEKIYTDRTLEEAKKIFSKLLEKYHSNCSFQSREKLTQRNVYLISYGDSFWDYSKNPLEVLLEVYQKLFKEYITDIHLLPMFPYTSDDGFAVSNYMEINPDLGTWEDIKKLSDKVRLMFDFVANHTSRSNRWFGNFLNQRQGFENCFIKYTTDFNISNVIRPRTSNLFHTYTTNERNLKVWTTFSEDQVDLNVKDPKTLGRLTEVLINYSLKGASSIRLDAIGFIWKESGTTCMNLPQTHAIVQLWRIILDELAPNTQLITETNVPHEENISYFGNTKNEATQVYQFALPPLVLYSFIVGNSNKLSDWARKIKRVSSSATYFNFLASHDGIGLRPTEGILTDNERELVLNRVIENGGEVSYKRNSDGTESVYELNINYADALKDKNHLDMTAKKMIAAHHILLSIIGVPAIYYHSILGSSGDIYGMKKTGIKRRINREKLNKDKLFSEIEYDNYRREIYQGITKLIEIRRKEEVFDPYGEQVILNSLPEIFALKRSSEKYEIVSYTNVSIKYLTIHNIEGVDIITGKKIEGDLVLPPYGIAWIKKRREK